jgi:hypothetical protein
LRVSPYSIQSEEIFANLINNANSAKTPSPYTFMSSSLSSSLCSLSLSSAASWNSTEDEDVLFKSAQKKNTNSSDTSQQQNLHNVCWSLISMSEGGQKSFKLEDKSEE